MRPARRVISPREVESVSKIRRLVGMLLSAGICMGASAGGDDENDRRANEAVALFRVIMAAEAPAHRCQFATDWMAGTVPEYIAARFLGLTIHADLAPPSVNTKSFEDTVDPKGKQSAAFCDRPASAAFEEARFDAFERDKSAKKVRIEHTAFTFPVFDAAYRKAIVIVLRSGIQRDRLMKLGPVNPREVVRHPGDSAEFANVYSRSNAGWTLVASELIGQS